MGKKLATTAISALYFVTYQHCSVLLAGLGQAFSELRSGRSDASDALNALDDAGRNVAFGKLLFPYIEIVEGKEGYMIVVVYGCSDLRIIGYLYCERCTAVERLLCGEDTPPACLERSELQTVFVGLRTAVDKEKTVVIIAAYLA